MKQVLRWLGQALAYALFIAFIGYFATAPAYSPIAADKASVTLSFTHVGKRKGECRQLSPEEIAKLPPNMRRPADCPRERLPVFVELELDGDVVLRKRVEPSGISKDRASAVYRRFTIEPGRRHLVARLRDSARTEGFDYVREEEVEIKPRQNFVIDFRSETGGFLFK